MSTDYQKGWEAHTEYLREQQAAYSAGSTPRTFAGVFGLIGFLLTATIIQHVVTDGWNNLAHPFIERALSIGLLLLVACYVLWEWSNHIYKRAQQAFNDKWNARRP